MKDFAATAPSKPAAVQQQQGLTTPTVTSNVAAQNEGGTTTVVFQESNEALQGVSIPDLSNSISSYTNDNIFNTSRTRGYGAPDPQKTVMSKFGGDLVTFDDIAEKFQDKNYVNTVVHDNIAREVRNLCTSSSRNINIANYCSDFNTSMQFGRFEARKQITPKFNGPQEVYGLIMNLDENGMDLQMAGIIPNDCSPEEYDEIKNQFVAFDAQLGAQTEVA